MINTVLLYKLNNLPILTSFLKNLDLDMDAFVKYNPFYGIICTKVFLDKDNLQFLNERLVEVGCSKLNLNIGVFTTWRADFIAMSKCLLRC